MTRRELREHCFKMIFRADFYSAEETEEQMELYFTAPEEDETTQEGTPVMLHQMNFKDEEIEYLLKKSEAVVAKLPELDAKINEVAKGWKTRRMGKVELTILRLAVYEMLYDEDIPEKVAINEAVELAKKFGQEESPAFINGVLAKLAS